MAKKTTLTWEEIPVIGNLGHTIQPGDQVFTFTQVYGRGTRVCRGTYVGTKKVPHRYNPGEFRETYVVQREDESYTVLHYAGMVPTGTSLDDLHDRVI
jgi:hypothetical protein